MKHCVEAELNLGAHIMGNNMQRSHHNIDPTL